jgi:DNA anti-recombination protein RmuC
MESIAQGIKITLDAEIAKAVVLDRDYRSMEEIDAVEKELRRTCQMAHIHHRKELENYLLIPSALTSAIERRCAERQKRTGEQRNCDDNVSELLTKITDARKREIESQFVTRYADSVRTRDPRIDRVTANLEAMAAFDEEWSELGTRLKVVPGKQILSDLNTFLQEKYSITLTAPAIISGMIERDVPKELLDLLRNLDAFCRLLV